MVKQSGGKNLPKERTAVIKTKSWSGQGDFFDHRVRQLWLRIMVPQQTSYKIKRQQT